LDLGESLIKNPDLETPDDELLVTWEGLVKEGGTGMDCEGGIGVLEGCGVSESGGLAERGVSVGRGISGSGVGDRTLGD
jgi:hypothetical protein